MKTLKHHAKRIVENFYLVLILIFLYAPIVTMMVLSFNSSKSRTQWGGFTLQWYTQMFDSATIMDALVNTLLIAFVSALIATIIGTAASIAINSMKPLPRTIIMGITNIPMLNADIVTGISLMLAFIAFGISLGFQTILIAHITFNIPYVILSVMPKLKQTNKSTYEAAMDLGANPFQTFQKVVLKLSMPGVINGIVMVFLMAISSFVIPKLLGGGQFVLIGNLIESQFVSVGDWNFGSAISLILAVLILVTMRLMKKMDVQDN